MLIGSFKNILQYVLMSICEDIFRCQAPINGIMLGTTVTYNFHFNVLASYGASIILVYIFLKTTLCYINI